jgi:hypothetical protein
LNGRDFFEVKAISELAATAAIVAIVAIIATQNQTGLAVVRSSSRQSRPVWFR